MSLVPPLKVNILHTETRFVAGEYADIRCEAIGSRPAAQITWWKDNERLADSSHKVRHFCTWTQNPTKLESAFL